MGWISKSAFEEKILVWEDFKAMSEQDGIRVIDARDNILKGAITPKAEKALTPEEKKDLEAFRQKNSKMLKNLSTKSRIIAQPFDKLINMIIAKGQFKDQTVLIFDSSGTQVQWLMYHLETVGYQDYFFLSGGTTAVIGMQLYGKK